MSKNVINSSLLKSYGTIACVDTSYMIYHTLFSAVSKWEAESASADVLTDVDVDDPSFQHIDITKYLDFVEILEDKTYQTIRRIMQIIDDYNGVTASHTIGNVLFVLDPPKQAKLKSWRYVIYPEYKGTRKSNRDKKPYNVRAVFNFITDMLLENPKFREHFNIDFVFADGCEADDLISIYFNAEQHATCKKLLIASDKDYLQLENVTQMTLEGKQVMIEQPYPDLCVLTPKTYLLAKIITGDVSDNITQVFNRVGYKTAVKKYVNNIDFLTESLKNDQVACEKFKRNARLIDFNKIPNKIRQIGKNVLGI